MNDIEMTPLDSSLLAAKGYDAETLTLRLQFKVKGGPGAVWDYLGVSPETYRDFLEAPSAGKFFLSAIKGKYEGRKVEG